MQEKRGGRREIPREVSGATAAANSYEDGIKNKMGGVSPYNDAMNCNTVKCAAETLEDARKRNLSIMSMKKAYRKAYA